MRGILSDAPSPVAARLMIGGELLLIVEALLVLLWRQALHGMLCALVVLMSSAALAALVFAIRGEPRERDKRDRRHFDAR